MGLRALLKGPTAVQISGLSGYQVCSLIRDSKTEIETGKKE